MSGEVLKLTATESLEVVSSSPEAFEVEASYGPNGNPPPAHFHPAQDEHFEVLAGTMRVKLDGVERDLGVGDTIEIGRGQVHQMWNPGGVPARMRWRTSPALRTEQWFRSIDAPHREGEEGGKGPDPIAFVEVLSEYSDVFRLGDSG